MGFVAAVLQQARQVVVDGGPPRNGSRGRRDCFVASLLAMTVFPFVIASELKRSRVFILSLRALT
jgi:hypothetical protein